MRNRLDLTATQALYLLVFLSGTFTTAAVQKIAGRKDPLDAGEYYLVGIPVMCVVILLVTWWNADRPWRWTLTQIAGQMAGCLPGLLASNLLPISVVVFAICSLPQFLIAHFVGRVRRKQPAQPQPSTTIDEWRKRR